MNTAINLNKKQKIITSIIFVVLIIGMVLGTIALCGGFKSNKAPEDITVVGIDDDLLNSDASKDKVVASEMLYRGYQGTGFILSLDKDGKYSLMPEHNSTTYFTGDYEVFNGDKVFDFIKKSELSDLGLNPRKINNKNLYYVKAYFDSHTYNSSSEYFNKDLVGGEQLSFDFIIYFKETTENSFIVAVCPVTDYKIDYTRPYF